VPLSNAYWLGRGSQPGVHVSPEVRFPVWRGTFKVGNRREKYIYMLFISKYLYKYIRILFSKIITCSLLNISVTKYFVKINFSVTVHLSKCWKGYMLIWWNAEGVHIHLSECWRVAWQEKCWEPWTRDRCEAYHQVVDSDMHAAVELQSQVFSVS